MKAKYTTLFFLALLLFVVASCKKDKADEQVQETGTVTDIDGNQYRTIKIGNQWWMAENLKTTKYRNGKVIQAVSNNSDWTNQASGAYCFYENKPENNSKYGCLYNWFAVTDTNQLAPDGWHIPNDAEFKALENELGMSNEEINKLGWRGSNEGEKLKIEAPQGWTEVSPVWGTNSSGFTALAGACRLFNGTWADPGLFACGFWWSTTEHSATEAMYRYLDKKNSSVFRSYTYKNYGFSIRCVKN